MKRNFLALFALGMTAAAWAAPVTVAWELSDPDNLNAVSLTGDGPASALTTNRFVQGNKIAAVKQVTVSNADEGLEPANYIPPFTAYTPATKVTSRTAGHCIQFCVDIAEGHSFKPMSVSFDAIKCGTDGGAIDICYAIGSGGEKVVASGVTPMRNKVTSTSNTAFSHHQYVFSDLISYGEPFSLTLYIMNINGADNSSPKQIGFRNVVIEGAVDEEITDVASFVTGFTCKGALKEGQPETIDLWRLAAPLKNGETATYPSKLYGDPVDFNITAKDGVEAVTKYEGHTLNVGLFKGESKAMEFNVRFKVTNRMEKGPATPLKRGLMSLSLTGAQMGNGNLVSWRHRASDYKGVKYKLYRGTTPDVQKVAMNRGLYIIDRTNFVDEYGTTDNYYKLETYSEVGELLETEVSGKTWADQTFRIPTNTPVDTYHGSTYTPNDASFCDMDGDGEYEIILKWSPANEKDAASSGTTSPAIFDCYKLDGTQLWRIDAGDNFFTSAHTMQFIAWDFDGDGYGEFMMKTAPGTIDGEGNYVILGDDDPHENFLSGRGKQDHGPEYITVFDGTTGAELATIPYHTDYAAGLSVWGDSNQNRSERYLAGLAYLDGPDANPSPIFARGYYSGAFVGAYDWDGKTLKERWVYRSTESGKGLWGEGAHWMSCGDCDGDGKHEIVYGSAALDHDGTLLYRTGLKHGDALHLGDFIPSRPGLEVFMVHEDKPYGHDLRDAATGEMIVYKTASGDTGRGVIGHFDPFYEESQFSTSSHPGMHHASTGERYTTEWAPGGGGSMNNRIYWDGDLYDEHYDKSCIAKWDHESLGFGRIQVNKTNYTIGKLNNASKYNPCVLGDLLGDWREEIVLWDESDNSLIINATSYPSAYRIPHLMDDLNYRVQVVNQNCAYNQPPHLSIDPAVVYKDNPNKAWQSDKPGAGVEDVDADCFGKSDIIYNIQGIKVEKPTLPGLYIINGHKTLVK